MPISVAAVILAAGAGRRYGMPKALVRVDGDLLIDRAVAVARRAGCLPVVVVLGAAADTVRARARLDSVRLVSNPDWESGMGSSLRAGLAALTDSDAAAAAILLVDLPGLTAGAVARVAAGAGRDSLRVATYGGSRGHPVLLGRAHWDGAAASATGDRGARDYLAAHAAEVETVPCDDIADGADLDVPPGR